MPSQPDTTALDAVSPTEEELWNAIGSVADPCMLRAGRGLSVRDMGIVRGVHLEARRVAITLTFTDPTCGQEDRIMGGIEAALRALAGVDVVAFEISCLPVWTNDWLSARARAQFAADRARRLHLATAAPGAAPAPI